MNAKREVNERRPGFSYSPDRRTALVLCGTGAHGAYHAGVLRALQEAGVKIDLLAGHGVGAGAAALAAIDGAARLWDADGVWRSRAARGLYGWKWPVRAMAWATLVLVAVLLTPLFFLALGVIVFPLGFLLGMFGADAGASLVAVYSTWLQAAFAGENLPTIVPRLVMVVLAGLVAILVAGAVLIARGGHASRRARGALWWRVLGAPLDARPARDVFTGAIWDLIRGAAPISRPPLPALGRRYAEVLVENLGQPGFRDLILVTTDLDARRDVVAALLREPFRHDFMAPLPGRDRRSEILDVAGVGRDHALDVVASALTPPFVCDPHLVEFARDSFWRGETHRLCDRPGAIGRLLEEVAAAGATQAIVVSAVSPTAAPHRLRVPRLDLRSRAGEFQTAAEATALRDALEMARLRFDSVYMVCPAHNPIGPFDFDGAYDEASDRRQDTVELMERAYEDAYRQFIEPVVGASGEQLARAGLTNDVVRRAANAPEG